MVSTPLKNISQIGSFPQVGMKIKNNWNHHLDIYTYVYLAVPLTWQNIDPSLTWHLSVISFPIDATCPSVASTVAPGSFVDTFVVAIIKVETLQGVIIEPTQTIHHFLVKFLRFNIYTYIYIHLHCLRPLHSLKLTFSPRNRRELMFSFWGFGLSSGANCYSSFR